MTSVRALLWAFDVILVTRVYAIDRRCDPMYAPGKAHLAHMSYNLYVYSNVNNRKLSLNFYLIFW